MGESVHGDRYAQPISPISTLFIRAILVLRSLGGPDRFTRGGLLRTRFNPDVAVM